MPNPEILIVEDERVIRVGLKATLETCGFAVRQARDGEDALGKIAERRPDLVLLDVLMPRMNGFRCCEEIRKRDALLPVVFLTANDSECNQVRAFDLGCDGFVSKAASEMLLVSCIRRAIDRSKESRKRIEQSSNLSAVRVGPVVVDLRFLSVIENDCKIATLTKTEADILVLLNEKRGELVLVDDIISGLRGQGFVCETTLVYSHISHLRRKLGRAAGLISNVRGIGYCLLR